MLAAQHVEGAQVVEVDDGEQTGASERRARASSRGSSSSHVRRVGRPVSPSDSASAPTRERSSSRSIATAAWAASSASMSATASPIASTAWRQIRISTPATWSPRSTGSNTAERAPVASTSGGGERRVGARVGDEVALARREGAAAVLGLRARLDRDRRDSTPTIAVDTNSRPAGSSRNATGLGATSQAARQTAGRASRLPASALASRARARPCRAPARAASRHPLQVARGALALELGAEHAGEHGEELLVGVA